MSEMYLSQLIYEKYYQAASNAGIVWTLHDLAVRDGLHGGNMDVWSPEDILEYQEHGQAIEFVMAMEITIYVFRRLNGPWGEVIDTMLGNRNRFCNEYREKTGYQIDTKQDHLIF